MACYVSHRKTKTRYNVLSVLSHILIYLNMLTGYSQFSVILFRTGEDKLLYKNIQTMRNSKYDNNSYVT